MASGIHEALRAAGLSPEGGPTPALRAECAGVARRVRDRGVRTLGLLPAGDGVAVPAVAIELGRALAERSLGLVGVLDGDGTWPCAPALREAAAAAAREGKVAATGWLAENLAILTPFRPGAARALGSLRAALAQEGGAFHGLVVDLSGFEDAGEHVAAFALLDGVAVVARSGHSTVREVQRRRRDLADRLDLGVLLTGA